MSSIKAEKIYRLANRLSRLALFLDEDNKSVIGQTLGVTEREEVRIACHFNVFR
jgi:hypothetical protein